MLSTKVDYYDGAGMMKVPDAVLAKLAVRSSLTPDSAKLILAMVGLPARGKSFICHKLHAFLSWSGHKTKVFNAGQKRRSGSDGLTSELRRKRSHADFFSASNEEAVNAREQVAMETLDELLHWLASDGEVALFDATNSKRSRRAAVVARAKETLGERVSVVFIESLCDDEAVLEANLVAKVRASPDFSGLDEADALADLRLRISNYEAVYEPVVDEEGAYVKLYNLSSKVTAHQVFGRMSKSVLPYMMSLHVRDRPVYLTAHLPGSDGHSIGNGSEFATKLAQWWLRTHKVDYSASVPLRLLSSTQPAAIFAASEISAQTGAPQTHQSGLNPLDRGTTASSGDQLLSSMTFEERFAGGESFRDLVRRLEPSLLEIEASMEPVLVLAHGSPCRALRAYFLNIPVEECMGVASSDGASALANEKHAVVELLPKVGGGWQEVIHHL